MKKIFGIALTLCLLVAAPAYSQFNWGIKAGVNLTGEPSSLKDTGFSREGKNGFFVGPMAKVIIPVLNIGLEGNLLYSQNEIEIYGETLKSQSINLPLYLRYELTLPLVNRFIAPFASIGPEFEWNIGDRSITLENVGELAKREYKISESNVSLNLGLGVTLFTHIQLHGNYNIALGKTADITETLADMKMQTAEIKTNTWQVSLTYIF